MHSMCALLFNFVFIYLQCFAIEHSFLHCSFSFIWIIVGKLTTTKMPLEMAIISRIFDVNLERKYGRNYEELNTKNLLIIIWTSRRDKISILGYLWKHKATSSGNMVKSWMWTKRMLIWCLCYYILFVFTFYYSLRNKKNIHIPRRFIIIFRQLILILVHNFEKLPEKMFPRNLPSNKDDKRYKDTNTHVCRKT